MDERNRKEYAGCGTEYEVTREEISKLKDEIVKPLDENTKIVMEIYKPADEFSEQSEQLKGPSNGNEKKKKNLFKQLAMSVATVGVIATLVFTSEPTEKEEVKYYPELVPYLAEMQTYIEENDNEAWAQFIKNNRDFFEKQKCHELGYLAFDGKSCYTLTTDSDFEGMFVCFHGDTYGTISSVMAYIGDFKNNLVNADMIVANMDIYDEESWRTTYVYTQWENSRSIGDWRKTQETKNYRGTAESISANIDIEGYYTGKVTIESAYFNIKQSCNFDENGKIILDELVYDLREKVMWSGTSPIGYSHDGLTLIIEQPNGEWVNVDIGDKVALFYNNKTGELVLETMGGRFTALNNEEPFMSWYYYEITGVMTYFFDGH